MRSYLPKLLTLAAICVPVLLSCQKARLTPEDLQKLPLAELRHLAEQGDREAQTCLGHRHFHAQGVPQDQQEAFKWYRKAAEKGLAEAQYFVGSCYGTGEGVRLDDVEGLKWTRRSANQGYDQAQFRLGFDYMFGSGVPKDLVEAYKWLRLSVVGGWRRDISTTTYGEQYMRRLQDEMTPEQIAEAKRRAEQFKPVKESPAP